MQNIQHLKATRFLFPALVFTFLSCKEQNKTVKPEGIAVKDSTLTLLNFSANPKQSRLSDEEAKAVLNSHFREKGYLIESELDLGTFVPEAEENYGKKAIDFIELKPINGSTNIVEYYNCEPFQNGSCVLPHHAIIANTYKGFKIIHEEFLPVDFTIDTVKTEKDGLFLYGYYYECPNKKKLQSYKIAIQ